MDHDAVESEEAITAAVERALQCEAEGDYAGAEAAYKEALELAKDDVSILCGLGGVYNVMQRLPEAEAYYDKALQVDASHLPALQAKAILQAARGDKYGAEQTLEQVLDLVSESPGAARVASDILTEWGDWERALETLERAGPLAGHRSQLTEEKLTVLLRCKQFDKAEQAFLEEQYRSRPNPQLLFLGSQIARARGDRALEKERLEGALAIDPSDGNALSWLLNLAMEEEDYRRAAQLAEHLAEIDPSDTTALFHLGRACLMMGEYQKAGKALEDLLEVSPGNRIALILLSCVLAAMGDEQAAEETYREALESPRQSAESEYFAGNILLQFDLPQYAEKHFADAVANLQDRNLALRARAQLGRALAAQGKIAEADSMLQQVLTESPDDAEAARALAGIYLDQGSPAEAAPLLRRALTANPDSADLLNDYATTLEAMGDTASAYEHYKRATQIDPSFAEAAENLALLCEGQGRLEEARDHFVAARDLFEKQGRYDEMHECINRISELMTRLARE